MANTPLHHFCNREILEELADFRERNVLLLLIDGTAIFGRVGRIDDCIISMVPPVGIGGLTLVQYRPPNPTLAFPLLVNQLYVDVCNLAHIVEGPFLFPPLSAPFPPQGVLDAAVPPGPPLAMSVRADEAGERPQRELFCELEELEGQNVAIATLGGWIIAGQLGEVSRHFISVISTATTFFPPFYFLGFVTVFGPVFPGGFTVLGGTFRVWSNLCALTEVVLP
ncbi:hypothetical protein [Anaeroselena agilis]|uniref:Uncharacterized protein n=1 Tax=Anaeroselena agilis TaxID=3063788 RepID=A0ABU3NWC3_9FIRM|nr:hypothetical protein [Selenomonadales bacterium 4137-cl]